MSKLPSEESHPHRSVVDGLRLVADFQQSGMSQAAFAHARGMSDKVVSYWVRRVRALKSASQVPVSRSPELVHVADVDGRGHVSPVESVVPRPVIPSQPLPRVAPVVGIEVRCGGRSLVVGPGFDRALLMDLVQTLEGLPSC